MFSALRRRLSYANVAATLALLFAMSGGALAASKFLITSTKQIKPSVLAQLKGKSGANGTPGAAGPAGPAGAQGPAGPQGTPGTSGKDGAAGTSASTVSFSGAQHGCKEGGVEVKSASPAAFVCNGEKGASGQTGFTETLPSGKTETGSWSVYQPNIVGVAQDRPPISFPIPISLKEGESGKAFYFNKALTAANEFGTSGCSGTVQKPTAPAGTLCVYTVSEAQTEVEEVEVFLGSTSEEHFGVFGPDGAIMGVALVTNGTEAKPAEFAAYGTWAVTAP